MNANEVLPRYAEGQRNFRSQDLKGLSLVEADLSGVDFTGANLSGADLSHADLSYANFNWTVLSGVI